jgi:hypothetical protein
VFILIIIKNIHIEGCVKRYITVTEHFSSNFLYNCGASTSSDLLAARALFWESIIPKPLSSAEVKKYVGLYSIAPIDPSQCKSGSSFPICSCEKREAEKCFI